MDDRRAPVLRRELIFSPRWFGSQPCYVLEDPLNTRFFRVGPAEYAFLSLMTRPATVRELCRVAKEAAPDSKWTEADALAICQWVVRNGLTEESAMAVEDLSHRQSAQPAVRRTGGRWSPLSAQVPLIYPNRLLNRVAPVLQWIYSWPAIAVWLAVVAWALRDVVAHWERVTASTSEVLSAGNWLWLGLAWVFLKVLHESGHALACKRMGGEVREAGVVFVLLAPLAYVDVTSTWRLRSKWQRIFVALAGMIVELFVAALAAIVWSRTSVGPLNQSCLNIMISAGFMTVLFNANPLMRFDGYYVFSDLLDLPNLYGQGQSSVSQMLRRVFFGVRSAGPVTVGWRNGLVRVYGLAAWAWRVTVFAGLILTATTLFAGAGVILSAAALVLWFGSIGWRAVRLVRDPSLRWPQWGRCAVMTIGLVTLAATLLTCLPWPLARTAPGIVRYAPETIVRANCAGFVAEVRVAGGQTVSAGEVLLVLVNRELECETRRLAVDLDEARLHRRVLEQQRELAKAQAEDERIRTLESRLSEKQAQVAQLVVRAPRAGQIIGRRLESLNGTWRERGSDLLAIGDESAKEIRLSIDQEDIEQYRTLVEGELHAYVPGVKPIQGKLAKVEPRATTKPLDASLCAPCGGILAARQVKNAAASPHFAQRYETLSPRFTGVIPLDPTASRQVRSGQRATVSIQARETVGEHLYQEVRDWLDRRLRHYRPSFG